MSQVQSGYVEFNDTRTYYEMGGNPNGRTLVFLHAAMLDRRQYDAQFEAFASDYRVVRYDLRGAGNTDAPMPSPTPYSLVDDLHKLLAHLKIDKATLIGTSDGSQVALDFALTYLEQVEALVLTSASLGGYEMPGEPPPLVIQFAQAAQSGDFETAADAGVQMWLVGIERKPEAVAEATRQKGRAMIRQALDKTGTGLGEAKLIDPPAVGRLGEVKIPTLVIIGEHDHPAVQEMDRAIAQGIRGAEMIQLNTAHLPSLEAPDEFTNDVKVFLDRVLE